MTVSPAQASGRPHREWLPIGLIGAAGLFLAALVALDTGGRGVALFALGAALGAVFLGFQYGFASAWRRFLTTGESMGLAAHFLLIGLVALVILPAAVLGLGATGSVAPVSVSLVVGAFLFGIGMQLANGCGSGVLFSFGGGSGRMLVALPFFILGSLLGSFLLPSVIHLCSLGQLPIAGGAGAPTGIIINLLLIALVGGLFYRRGRRRGETMSRHLILATLVIAVLCWLVFALSGHPWGVTFGFTLWGAKIAAALGVPVDSFVFWQWAGPRRALAHSVLADVSSLMDIGMIPGRGDGGLGRRFAAPGLAGRAPAGRCRDWWHSDGNRRTAWFWLQYRCISGRHCVGVASWMDLVCGRDGRKLGRTPGAARFRAGGVRTG